MIPAIVLLSILAVATSPVASAAVAAASAFGSEEHLESLLRTREEHRVAHRTGDVDRWIATLSDPLVSVDDGQIRVLGLDAFREHMEPYLERTTFLAWDDARVPIILMSEDSTFAGVVVAKRVRLVSGESRSAFDFAWNESWRRKGGEWRMVAIASTDRPSAHLEGEADAWRRTHEVLSDARSWLGGEEHVAEVAMVRFSADCMGPDGAYRTRSLSARDGRFLFAQDFETREPFSIGRSLKDSWLVSGGELSEHPADAVLTIAHAHEWALLALAPESRYRAPLSVGRGRFGGQESEGIRFRDLLDAEAVFHYDPETGRPLGFEIANHSGRGAERVVTSFADWKRNDRIRWPSRVEITHGEEEFRCDVHEVEAAWFPDSSFRPSRNASSP